MKVIITLAAIAITASTIAQTNAKKVEIFKRYENGVLVEYDSIVKEGDEALAEMDLDFGKDFGNMFKDFNLGNMGLDKLNFGDQSGFGSNFDFESKMHDMESRIQEMQLRTNQMMESTMAEMESRMSDMQTRMQERQAEMRKKMDGRLKENGDVQKPQITPKAESNNYDPPANSTTKPTEWF